MGDGAEPTAAELQTKALNTYKKGHDGRVPVTVLTGFLGAVRPPPPRRAPSRPRRPRLTRTPPPRA